MTTILATVTLVEYTREDKIERPLTSLPSDQAIGYVQGIAATGHSLKNITAIFTRSVAATSAGIGRMNINHDMKTVLLKEYDSASFVAICEKCHESISVDEWVLFIQGLPGSLQKTTK